jgi:hypothetical protein
VTSSPRPDEPGSRPTRRPDSTDPDLSPLPPRGSLAETGHLPAYPSEGPALVAEGDDPEAEHDPYGGDHEAVEDGLRGSREPAAASVAERISRRPRDMVISIGLLLVIVFGLFGLYSWLGGDDGGRVDPAQAISEARAANEFPVAVPTGLSDKWTSVSAVYQPQAAGAVLRIGWRTPGDGTIQLIEGNLPPDTLLTRELGANARDIGDAEIGGNQWQVYDAREGERAYVQQQAGRTIIVVGKTSEAEFKQFIESLR